MEGRSVIFKKIDQISKYVKAHESSLSLLERETTDMKRVMLVLG